MDVDLRAVGGHLLDEGVGDRRSTTTVGPRWIGDRQPARECEPHTPDRVRDEDAMSLDRFDAEEAIGCPVTPSRRLVLQHVVEVARRDRRGARGRQQ